MGVKSTVRLTREQAEERYVSFKLDQKKAKLKRKAAALSDIELENRIEQMNDEARGGEGFENYLITDEA